MGYCYLGAALVFEGPQIFTIATAIIEEEPF
jgi:hypothetical protein